MKQVKEITTEGGKGITKEEDTIKTKLIILMSHKNLSDQIEYKYEFIDVSFNIMAAYGIPTPRDYFT